MSELHHESPFWTIQRFLWTCSRQGFLFVRQNLFIVLFLLSRAGWLAFVKVCRFVRLKSSQVQSSSTYVPNTSSLKFVYTFNDDILLLALCPIMLLSFTEFNVAKFVLPMAGVLWIRTNMSSSKYALFHSPTQFKVEAQNKKTFTERAETLKHNFSVRFSLFPLV